MYSEDLQTKDSLQSPLTEEAYRTLEGFDSKPPCPPDPPTRRSWGWEDWGKLFALIAFLIVIGAISWAETHPPRYLPPITREQQSHCALQKKVAVYHGDNKVHCDAP